jgi:hypothetical protein
MIFARDYSEETDFTERGESPRKKRRGPISYRLHDMFADNQLVPLLSFCNANC